MRKSTVYIPQYAQKISDNYQRSPAREGLMHIDSIGQLSKLSLKSGNKSNYFGVNQNTSMVGNCYMGSHHSSGSNQTASLVE